MDKTNSAQMAKLAIKALEDKKAEDVRVIDISEISVLADYFIIANGLNVSQVQAMSDNVQEVLGRAGYDFKQVEGYQSANWILLDYGDIIVHISTSKVGDFLVPVPPLAEQERIVSAIERLFAVASTL